MGVDGRIALVVALALGAGCLESSITACEDGVLCPAGTRCSSQGCVLPEQIDACAALDDGDRCTFSGVSNGRCVDGVCVSFGCGNDVIEADQGEVCDDGNTESGDGCRADCQKLEVCGDEVEDAGEACDDGNTNAADGCDACAETAWAATAIVGGGIAPTSVGLAYPSGIAIDAHGNVYITDRDNHRIRRFDVSGATTVLAGTGTSGYSGDGGAATSAALSSPYDLAVDGLGNVFFTDSGNSVIRRIDGGTGIITTVAGTGNAGFDGDDVAATSAMLFDPQGVAVDGLGNLYIADTSNQRIRRVDGVTGLITTIVGTGTYGFAGDGGAATNAELRHPKGMAFDAGGNLVFADSSNHRIRRVAAGTGVITTLAGDGTAQVLSSPSGVFVDALGNLYYADTGNSRIRRIAAGSGSVTTVAGTGVEGYDGDGVVATSARLWFPGGVTVDALGNLYIADTRNDRVRRVSATTGLIEAFAGTGSHGGTGYDGAATTARLDLVSGVAVRGGAVYLADTFNNRIRRLDPGTEVLVPVAGTGLNGDAGDGGPALAAELRYPTDLLIEADGDLYFADSANNRIRKIDGATGVITTVAGRSPGGAFSGDGGPATAAELSGPAGLAIDSLGRLLIGDSNNDRIRRVDLGTGIITTTVGNGTEAFFGDGGLATAAHVWSPWGGVFDPLGNFFIADTLNHRIRRVDVVSGIITTVAGTGTPALSGDGGQAALATLAFPKGLAFANGNLYIVDRLNHRVRRIDAGGVITTVAGTTAGNAGDGGPATAAQLDRPQNLAVDAAGNLFIADAENHRLRRVDGTTGVITTLAGAIDPEGMGPLATAHLVDPRAVVPGSPFALIAGGASGTVQAVRSAAVEVVTGRYSHPSATANLARFRAASFGTVGGLAYDAAAGLIYLTESPANRLHVVTMVDPDDENTWTIAPLANAAGTAGFADGALATARFRAPSGLFLDEVAQVLYVADTGNHVIRAIDLATSTVTTIAGTPATLGFFGDTGLATDALLYQPEAITRCSNGDLFVADTGNQRVRRITSGVITTVLGDGVAASSGQGEPAREFPVREPRGLACDATGNLYVTSSTTVRQVAADELGVVDGSGPVSSIFGEPPRTEFPASVTYCLSGLAIVDDTSLQITDSCTGMLIELHREAAP